MPTFTHYPTIDATSPAALEAQRQLEELGIKTWIHDRIYALRSDSSAPHGFRIVAAADSFPKLLKLVRK